MTAKYTEVEHDPRQLWQLTKENIDWQKNASPNTISQGGKTYHKPKEIFDVISHEQISHNIQLSRKVPKTKTDPMQNYAKITEGKKLNFKLQQLSMR